MRLSQQDRIELIKAAHRATRANDLPGLTEWIFRLAEVVEELPEGKNDAPVPAYKAPGTPPQGNGHQPYLPQGILR